MIRQLEGIARSGECIRVALVGAGSMGVGIAWQVARTPGLRLVSITDVRAEAVAEAAAAAGARLIRYGSGDLPPGAVWGADDPRRVLDDRRADVLVESTNSIGFAAGIALEAVRAGVHVVLMNAEVDLALGPLLAREAARHGVVVTSDAGDQHGVLARMIEEIRLWGFGVEMAGNIKGFLDRRATPKSVQDEARIRYLDPVQCCAYTDGTKLNIEMAIVANGFGLLPRRRGMTGPRAGHVREALELFSFDAPGDRPTVDYVLGAEPGGGVFVVGSCAHPLQQRYLAYYKMGPGPRYLFYRPYHLCHLETTWAVADAALNGRPVLAPPPRKLADVYAIAKRPLAAGEAIVHAIGGDQLYGEIERRSVAEREKLVPIALLEAERGRLPRATRPVRADEPLCWDDVEPADTAVMRLHELGERAVAELEPVGAASAASTSRHTSVGSTTEASSSPPAATRA